MDHNEAEPIDIVKHLEQENRRLNRLLRRYEALLTQSDKMSASKEKVNKRLYEELESLSRQLEQERNQLLKTNDQLQQSMQERAEALSEIAVLEERNRIASDIHDVAGHTLTATVVQMEAIKRLIEHEPSLAVKHLESTQELVRKSLDEIRRSVRRLKSGDSSLGFLPSMEKLIYDTSQYTGISVNYNFGVLPKLPAAQQTVLYHALQEGLTNGIRHGKATKFWLNLVSEGNYLLFSLKDNGVGFDELKFGFGLSVMKERVESLKGTLHFFSEDRNGCMCVITIPLDAGGESK